MSNNFDFKYTESKYFGSDSEEGQVQLDLEIGLPRKSSKIQCQVLCLN